MLGSLGVVVVIAATTWIAAVLLLWTRPHATAAYTAGASFLGASAGGTLAHFAWPERAVIEPLLVTTCAVALAAWVYARAWSQSRRQLTPAGALAWIAWLVFGAVTTAWAVQFLAGLNLSPVTTTLMWAAVAIAAVTVPSAVITTREGWEPLLRQPLRAPEPDPGLAAGFAPRISIHVPCHAEPPHLVISTLDRLAALDYANFEVLVIDNNTTDPELWQPVQAHCEALGDRFRFFHVEGLTGAKAGALNWALPRTHPTAELIAVVDADYHVEPTWLRETVGHFTDPRLGFVQAPHAYRDYQGSRFATWANSEYGVFFQTGMVSLDERGAGLTVGTMSLIRKEALLDAGGWAEWCLTEDSELAIRIHAAGYTSVYLTTPYGRGLVPDTFDGYRRQRFRWTFGPVQETRRHWRLFLPRFLGGRDTDLTGAQKLHHANHGLDVIGIGVRTLALAVSITAAVSMVVHHETVRMPYELWIASTAALGSSWLMRLLVYRRLLGATTTRALGGIISFAALNLVITVASLRATIGLTSAWHRTNKFRSRSSWRNALAAAWQETALAAGCITLAVGIFAYAPGHRGIALMLAIALAAKGVTFLSASLLALIANKDLQGAHAARPASQVDPIPTQPVPRRREAAGAHRA